MVEPLVVRREVQIAAPPTTVFAFLTDPQKILRWMGTEATLEPHPGGLYLVNVTGKDIARGKFTVRLQLRVGRPRKKCAAGVEPDRDRPDRS